MFGLISLHPKIEKTNLVNYLFVTMNKKDLYVGNGLSLWDEHQYEHFQRVCKILHKNTFYVDQSLLGTGKSYIALAICITYGLPLFVICPVAVMNMWKTLSEKYNIIMIDNLSYSMLQGKGKKVNHPYLFKREKNEVITYHASEKFQSMCNDGLMLVIDEASMIKNASNQNRSVQALCDAVIQSGNSRVAFLSASLIDKIPMALEILRVIGYYGKKSDKIYSYNVGTRTMDYSGYKEIVENCSRLDPKKTDEWKLLYLPEFSMGQTNPGMLKMIHTNVYYLFKNVVLEHCASSMPDPDLPADMKNGFYWIYNEKMRELAAQASDNICRASGYTSKNSEIHLKQNSWNIITTSLQMYEKALLEVCVRETLLWTVQNPHGKVVIFAHYTESLLMLHQQLQHLGAQLYYGEISKENRTIAEDRFQNDPSCRVFIGNMACSAMGINLHDISKKGNEKRLELLLPTYKLMDIYQASGRVRRRGMTSEATVRIVYAENAPLASVIDAICRKSNVLSDINDRPTLKKRRIYPGDFENEVKGLDFVYQEECVKKFIERQTKMSFQEIYQRYKMEKS